MKVAHNDDGTVTVTIPKSDEVYDASDGGLYVAETLPAQDFAAALGVAPEKAPAKPRAKRPAKTPATPSPTPGK